VDPQLQGIPAASILKVLEKKELKDIEDQTLIMADVAQKAIDQRDCSKNTNPLTQKDFKAKI
jgi:hypothetical protein